MRGACLPLVLSLAACAGDETISGYVPADAVFVLEEIDGKRFEAEASISFPAAGEVAGRGPCNGFGASQAVPYPWIEIGAIRATERACPQFQAETRFFEALVEMTLADALGDVLILSNDAGREMLFRAFQPNLE